MVGDERSGKPSGLSGSGDFDMDAVRLQRAEDSRLEARSCTRGYGVDQRRSRLREAFVFASGKVRRLARRLGGVYSPPLVGLKPWKAKGVLIPLRMRFFFALWSQPRKGKVSPGLLR